MSTTSSALSGLASGIDWTSIVNNLLVIERAPETQMNSQVTALQKKNAAYQGIATQLTTLQADVKTLSTPSFFDSRLASSSNTSIASATAATATALGSYSFNISQLASDAVQQGSGTSGKPLSATNDVSTLVLSSSGFATPITAGTFSVNGQTVTIATSDTLQAVFDKIRTATGGNVTASYEPSSDTISLVSTSGNVILGSATDTSNFLQTAKLYNNGTNTVTSTSGLGGVNLAAPINSSNIATTISDGGSGAGQFLINGVQISFNSSTDSVNDVLQRINNSTAGVTATYDSINDRFELTNKTTGDIGISLQDVTGNFLAATGLNGGTLQRGKNLQYTVNGGGTLTSQSNTISGSASGVTGLSVQATGLGTTAITIGSDASKISSAISSFVNDYNAAQTYISTQITPTHDASGNITPGVLTGDLDVGTIATALRRTADASPSGLSGVIKSLTDLGILSNGSNNQLALSDTTTLNTALSNNLAQVKSLFSDATNGIATKLNTYLMSLTDTNNGVLANDEANVTKQSTAITASIAALETRITNDKNRLTQEFVNMEKVINSLNSQKQYLSAYFNTSSSSAQTAPTAASSSSS